MSAQWIGFDGWGSYVDVLQAGTVVDGCPAAYAAWYEWYTVGCNVNSPTQPCYSWVANLPVNPGDLMYGEVWYTTSIPNGHAFLFNYTTGQYFSVGFNQPSSTSGLTSYAGSDVEWIVERPERNGSLTDLTNYVSDQFHGTFASNGVSSFYPGSSPNSTINISMTCSPWNPSSSCTSTTEISIVDL